MSHSRQSSNGYLLNSATKASYQSRISNNSGYQNGGEGFPPRSITGQSILSERIVEHQIKVPRKVVREEIVEKVVVVPEKVIREEMIEEVQMVKEKIIEIAKPVIQEKYIEVPRVEYVEKIVKVPEIIYKEVVKRVPKREVREKIVQVPRVVYKEKIVEVPEYEYKEVLVEKIVEVPKYEEEVVVREVTVPQYVDKPVPNYVTVEVPEDIQRIIPVPVEATTSYEFLLPRLKAKHQKVQIPIYAPRFVEVPVPAELMDPQVLAQAEHLSSQVAILAARQAPSLCELEELVKYAQAADFNSHISQKNLQGAIEDAWKAGRLTVSQK